MELKAKQKAVKILEKELRDAKAKEKQVRKRCIFILYSQIRFEFQWHVFIMKLFSTGKERKN